jgi:hypothetical protein
MAKVSVRLRFPTLGHKRGDVLEVEKAQAAALVANGSARLVKVEKSDKD